MMTVDFSLYEAINKRTLTHSTISQEDDLHLLVTHAATIEL